MLFNVLSTSDETYFNFLNDDDIKTSDQDIKSNSIQDY